MYEAKLKHFSNKHNVICPNHHDFQKKHGTIIPFIAPQMFSTLKNSVEYHSVTYLNQNKMEFIPKLSFVHSSSLQFSPLRAVKNSEANARTRRSMCYNYIGMSDNADIN